MSSSSPWMKGVAVVVADPITPLHEHDKRPAVRELIEKHREKIDKVRVTLETDPLYESSKHDDLWILRFLLSHKNKTAKVIKAAKETLVFRKEHNLDAEDIRNFPPHQDTCKSDAMKRYLVYAEKDFVQGCVPDGSLGAIIFLHMHSLDQHGLLENVAAEDWLPTFCYVNEWAFQWCDYVTRTTGRLTKLIRLVDLDGMPLSKVNKEVSKRDTGAMNVMEDFYPQLLQSVFLCNFPNWLHFLWSVFRPLVPKRVIDKMDMIAPKGNEKERNRLSQYISMENLPARYGGEYEAWPVQYPLPK